MTGLDVAALFDWGKQAVMVAGGNGRLASGGWQAGFRRLLARYALRLARV